MIKLICPFSGEVIDENNNISHWLSVKSKELCLSYNDLRHQVYEATWPALLKKEVFEEYYLVKQYSLPLFLKEFFLPYRVTLFMLDRYQITKRSIRESAKIGNIRACKTLGVESTTKTKLFLDGKKLRDNSFGELTPENLDKLKLIVAESDSVSEIGRKFGKTKKFVRAACKKYGIDISLKTTKIQPEDIFNSNILRKDNSAQIRWIKKLNLLPIKCSECSLGDSWNNKKLVLQLDHIDGNRENNNIENLRFLCPNCHSQQFTSYGRRFKGTKKQK